VAVDRVLVWVHLSVQTLHRDTKSRSLSYNLLTIPITFMHNLQWISLRNRQSPCTTSTLLAQLAISLRNRHSPCTACTLFSAQPACSNGTIYAVFHLFTMGKLQALYYTLATPWSFISSACKQSAKPCNVRVSRIETMTQSTPAPH